MDKNKLIQNAQKFIQKGQLDKAIREYQRVVEADPRDVRARLKLGDLFAKRGSAREAAETYLKVAEAYSQQGFFLKAVAVYKQVLKLEPRGVEVNVRLAELYDQLGLMSDAMTQYQVVANFYETSGDIRASFSTLRKMLDLDPDNVPSRIKLAEMYSKEGMVAEAVEQFGIAADHLKQAARVDDWAKVVERLVYHDTTQVGLVRELAEAYLSRGDTKRGLAKLQVCFKADPRDVRTLELLARAFVDLEQPGKSISVYKELARLHDEAGDLPARADAWRRVHELAPDDVEAQTALGLRPAAPAPAPRPATEAPRPAPVHASAPEARPAPAGAAPAPVQEGVESLPRLLTETDVYVKYGLYEKAADHLRRALALAPDHVDALERLARVHRHMGRLDEAADVLEKLLAGPADDQRAAGWREDLAEIAPHRLEPDELAFEEEAGLPEAQPEDDPFRVDDEPFGPGGADPDDEPLLTADEDADGIIVLGLEDEAEGSGASDDDDAIADDDALILGEADALPDEDEAVLGEADLEALDASGDLLVGDPDEDDGLLLGDADDVLIGGSDEDDAFVFETEDADEPEAEPDGVHVLDDSLLDADLAAAVAEAEAALATHRPAGGGESEDLDASAQPAPPEASPIRPEGWKSAEEIADELEEGAFFLQQGLTDEARDVLKGVLAAVPGHEEALSLLAAIERDALAAEAGLHDEPSAPAPEGPVGFDDFDLASELAAELAQLEVEDDELPLASAPLDDVQISASEVFEEFKRGVARSVSGEDAETHYDLGIAYREMGLTRDAIQEFQLAARRPERHIDALTMVGLCLRELGELEEAVAIYETALADPMLSAEAAKSLHYDLGDTWQALGHLDQALEHFRTVRRLDPRFRDAMARLEALGPTELAPEADPEPEASQPSPGPRSKKVGYV